MDKASTLSGNKWHYTEDGVKTLCGRKVTDTLTWGEDGCKSCIKYTLFKNDFVPSAPVEKPVAEPVMEQEKLEPVIETRMTKTEVPENLVYMWRHAVTKSAKEQWSRIITRKYGKNALKGI